MNECMYRPDYSPHARLDLPQEGTIEHVNPGFAICIAPLWTHVKGKAILSLLSFTHLFICVF